MKSRLNVICSILLILSISVVSAQVSNRNADESQSNKNLVSKEEIFKPRDPSKIGQFDNKEVQNLNVKSDKNWFQKVWSDPSQRFWFWKITIGLLILILLIYYDYKKRNKK